MMMMMMMMPAAAAVAVAVATVAAAFGVGFYDEEEYVGPAVTQLRGTDAKAGAG
jgi:hypothetical protein